jgi:hypothetical protein
MDVCEDCLTDIRGKYIMDAVVDFSTFFAPAYCHECGPAFPWTEKKFGALSEVVDSSDVLSTEEKEEFMNDIKDITSESPRTTIAVNRIKELGSKLTKGMWEEVAKPLIVDIASEAAKKSLGF